MSGGYVPPIDKEFNIVGSITGRAPQAKSSLEEKPRQRKAKALRHHLVPRRVPGQGKQLAWVCTNKKCHFKDTGGTQQVWGCPKPPPSESRHW